ncbi:hypothetical protein F441_14339 [Phytophthora nicotianae CJ01A1]|uniref:Uncharacterized protein n=6 Tax=Phytophthora nicotianae TaxID=4792 RepID=W2PUR5_PHYN3|nr:hypothetical protein PPTG_23584 [Phytophthora nicotianae INRA-310]ETI40018.1 hypothetical protein F443_14461 [Phytophthora nicotianae P1569]ETK80134.1 hypothetical protein L915_14110 [Phytophthora nicotianae]ETO68724.1 hypothetical protein F444_14459 [Phytophthora nicotianae P1976]ETP09887.1 hypothetical protein F441_14339 [Phytophthora nicotianae CJ01A1]ETP37954.1 hypothetical protein F442_14303 [Phytophthora nicotianae P10297]
MADEPVRRTPSWSHSGTRAPKRERPRNARPLSAQVLCLKRRCRAVSPNLGAPTPTASTAPQQRLGDGRVNFEGNLS